MSGDFSRTLVTVATITLPACGNVFGVAPCTAAGTACWNTPGTCKDPAHFVRADKIYSFSSADSPLPFPGPRPYLQKYSPLPPEIKDSLTVSGRIKLELYDEPDDDVGIDPYVTTRLLFPHIPGRFWRKLVARNPRYKGAQVAILQGDLGDPQYAYLQVGAGIIDTISFAGGTGYVTIDILDQLQALRFLTIPPTLGLKLAADMPLDGAVCFLAGNSYADTGDFALLGDTGYLKLDAEICHFSAADPATNKLTIDQRGCFGTTSAAHSASAAAQPVKYYPPTNAFDLMLSLLLDDAQYAPASVDTAAFNRERDWYPDDIPLSAVIDTPTDGKTLFLEIVQLLNCRAWVDEQARITITRGITNPPGQPYPILTDAANIVDKTSSVDMGDSTSSNVVNYASGVVLYWDMAVGTSVPASTAGGNADPTGFRRVDAFVDPSLFDPLAEALANDTTQSGLAATGLQLKKVFCRWLRPGYVPDEALQKGISSIIWRLARYVTQTHPVITAEVQIKDADLVVGQVVDLITDELVNPDGTNATVRSLIVRKEPKGATIALKFQRVNNRRFLAVAPAELAGLDWYSATPEQREYGFIADENGLMPDGSEGYYLW